VFVLGPIRRATKEALVFAHVRKHPTILPTQSTPQIIDPPLEDLEIEGDDIGAVLANGKRHHIDVLYPAMRTKVRSDP
jgi:hypothetical protein